MLRSLLCHIKKFVIEEFVIRVLHCVMYVRMYNNAHTHAHTQLNRNIKRDVVEKNWDQGYLHKSL